MNKSQLVSKVAEKSGLTKKDAAAALESFIETVEETLQNGEKVVLVGFGTFEVKTRGAHIGRNPRTGEAIEVAEKKVPVFKAGKEIKEKIGC